MIRSLLVSISLLACITATAFKAPPLPEEVRFNHLDPLSIQEQFAFYHLYPSSDLGKKALQQAWTLLTGTEIPDQKFSSLILPDLDVQGIVSLITRQPFDSPIQLTEHQLEAIETFGNRLSNRKLPGHRVWTKEDLDRLPPEDIDLGRGLLLNQFEDSADFKKELRQYEATLDLMALQILARLPPAPTFLQKIDAINTFIFHEMQFRFPPHSLYPGRIDLYTLLPSVIDGRRGVCLGVSILYLCLAQRLDLPLEIVTPPGHIYLRFHDKDHLINIETTARGINVPSEMYLGINTRKLPQRTMREVLGMAYFNHASVAWNDKDYKTAISLYKKSAVYQEDYFYLKTFFGLSLLLHGDKKEALNLLEEVAYTPPDEAVSKDTFIEDYLNGKVDIKGLKTIFLPVDETRESILKKQKKLQKTLQKCPEFRAGLFQLAITHLQLNQLSDAFKTLQKYHDLDPTDTTVEYYLALIAAEQHDFNKAHFHLTQTQMLTSQRDHYPKALKSLKSQLQRECPLPNY